MASVAGRLTRVTENGIGPGGSNTTTTYIYDGMDNLISVTQGAQTRSFIYDSLNRLTSAVNVESGTTCYSYDNDGNLFTRRQVANSNCGGGILTSYYYDYLNRTTSKVMPEGTVSYTYDQGPYGIGRLYSVSYGGSITTYSAHDSLGRVTSHTQTVNNVPYSFSYTYNATDGLTSMTYPSGRQVVFTYDTAVRVDYVGSVSAWYAAGVTYGAQGAVGSFQIGNGLWETTNFDSRLQTRQVSLGSCAQTGAPGTPACSQDQWWLQNVYSVTGNNGNILQQTIGLPGQIQISEAYAYDTANRLTVASERSSNPSNPPFPDPNCLYCAGYTYDIWGNRTEAEAVGGLPTWSSLAPGSFSAATNQITSAGWAYETTGRGNITQEPGGRTYLYDSENRQVAFCTQDPGGCVNQSGPGRTLYVYDGDGRRVQKLEPAGTTTYVYDAQGNLAAEYSTEPGTSQTLYLTADQLGTTRVVTTGTPSAPSVVARRDYLPFGEQIVPASGDPRQNVAGYAQPEGVTMQFTGMERDNETGLDNFGARYMSSAQGRFASPDPSNLGVDFSLPQAWNRYAYVGNNPLRYVDRNGLWWTQTHNAAIAEALPGLSVSDLKSVQAGSLAADTRVMGVDSQLPAMSFAHNMSDATNLDRINAISTAMGAQANFVAAGQAAAITEQANWTASGHTGISPKALQIFGNFTHPLVDATSPAHEGFQGWGGCTHVSSLVPVIGGACLSFGGIWHGLRETPFAFTGQRKADAIGVIQYYFLQTFGEDAYQQATQTPAQEDVAPSHQNCLVNRETGQCAQ